MAATDNGFGVTVTWESGFCAEIIAVRFSGMERQEIETTHSTSTDGWATFIPSDIKDLGELEVDLNFDADDTPPLTEAAETCTVTFPTPVGGSSGATVAASAFMKMYSIDVPIDNRMTATATLKYSGAPTWVDAT